MMNDTMCVQLFRVNCNEDPNARDVLYRRHREREELR